MKQTTCSTMGGPATCMTVLSGNTPEEMVAEGMKHATSAHPEMAAMIAKMTPEETTKWMAEFKTKFDALPEVTAAAA